MSRQSAIDRLYERFAQLKEHCDGFATLGDSDLGSDRLPERGVYFFFASDEQRSGGEFPRLTRIGTHATSAGSGRSLWQRLREHRGSTRGKYAGGGNHRASSFRKEVGGAFIERDELHDAYPDWYEGTSSPPDLRETEQQLEERVSSYIRDLPLLWVEVDDPPGRDSDRAVLEQQLTALVSNFDREPIDPRDERWLGHHNPNETIRRSGLWSLDFVEEPPNPAILDTFEHYVSSM